MTDTKHCGYVAIIGRPNVGKSTLLNQLLAHKLSITARKPQTTRHAILGVLTHETKQAIFIDTPGLHLGKTKAINRYMNRAASSALVDADVVILVIEALRWTEEDAWVLTKLAKVTSPVLLVINKVDQVKQKTSLLPFIEELSTKHAFKNIIPLSAQTGDNVAALMQQIMDLLPIGEHLFPPDQLTDRNQRFLATEIVREKLIRHLGDELPHELSVTLEEYKVKNNVIHMHMIIWVERKGQKVIVVGRDGELLKKLGTKARLEMEKMFGQKVYLNLWVKVKSGWTDNNAALKQFGYE